MSKSRQQVLRSLSVKYPTGHRIDWHSHGWSQLIYATEGAMTVSLKNGRWVVPARRAIHVRRDEPHRIEMHGRVFMRTIYLNRAKKSWLDNVVVNVNSLMHELIEHVCDRGIVRPVSLEDRTLIRFFEQQLELLHPLDSELKMPQDERANRFAKRILADPATKLSLGFIATECGTSLRTMQRVFPQEVGMSVSKWRQRVRMQRAIEYLGQGRPVTDVAFSLGFEGVSAFIHSFKQCFGVTPGKYRPKDSLRKK